jgi:hypothetical protein
MAAGGGDGLAGGPDPRSLHQPLVDRIAQVRGDVAAEVAHAGEAGQQGLLGIAHAAEGEVDIVEAEAFGVALRAGLAAQVHVQVGPAGHAGAVGQVDGGCLRHGFHATRQHVRHLAVAHHHGMRSQQLAAAAVEQLAAVQGGARAWRIGGERGHAKRGQHDGGKQLFAHGVSPWLWPDGATHGGWRGALR